jgi:dTDP-4-dehydrorhamnose 3,5-epimerase
VATAEGGSLVKARPLSLPGLWVFDAPVWGDDRGYFREWFKAPEGAPLPFAPQQANLSRSVRNVVRGLHYSVAPEGQAKVVTCAAGSVFDVVVDIREGSPTFGQHEVVLLHAEEGRSLVLPAGVAHGFCAISDEAVLTYLLSSPYQPSLELAIHPFDADLAIAWPLTGEAVLSAKDAAAPSWREQQENHQLPTFRQ